MGRFLTTVTPMLCTTAASSSNMVRSPAMQRMSFCYRLVLLKCREDHDLYLDDVCSGKFEMPLVEDMKGLKCYQKIGVEDRSS